MRERGEEKETKMLGEKSKRQSKKKVTSKTKSEKIYEVEKE